MAQILENLLFVFSTKVRGFNLNARDATRCSGESCPGRMYFGHPRFMYEKVQYTRSGNDNSGKLMIGDW
jgi:hypothetical protein